MEHGNISLRLTCFLLEQACVEVGGTVRSAHWTTLYQGVVSASFICRISIISQVVTTGTEVSTLTGGSLGGVVRHTYLVRMHGVTCDCAAQVQHVQISVLCCAAQGVVGVTTIPTLVRCCYWAAGKKESDLSFQLLLGYTLLSVR